MVGDQIVIDKDCLVTKNRRFHPNSSSGLLKKDYCEDSKNSSCYNSRHLTPDPVHKNFYPSIKKSLNAGNLSNQKTVKATSGNVQRFSKHSQFVKVEKILRSRFKSNLVGL